ncbi:MAG: hypothetical protein HS117_21035 [Verrucomicrobiaceae bacterium]|nr:hypothetical protein [Verrucomicrobiaceae bacterium]
MTRPWVCRILAGIETSSSSSQQASDHRFFGGSQEFLRRAAQSLADAGPCDDAAGEGQSIDDEVRALSWFISDAGLELKSEDILATLTANPMKGGKEHRVAFLPEVERVLKVADARMLATESLFDYLTDLLLSNHYFDDDIRLEGAYTEGGRLFIVTTQPYISGIHPDWPELRAGLARHQLRDPAPRSLGGNFIFDDELLGEVDVFDLHPNNVIQDASGWLNPIDAHFYFDDRIKRIAALQKLGLLAAKT